MPSLPPPLQKIKPEDHSKILQKYTRANIKMTLPLNVNQLVEIMQHFMACTLNNISVNFINFKGLEDMISTFTYSELKHQKANQKFDISEYAEAQFKLKNTFACFLFYLERKNHQKPTLTLFQLIIEHLIQITMQKIKAEIDEEKKD